jgi:signal transduction histidine kinase
MKETANESVVPLGTIQTETERIAKNIEEQQAPACAVGMRDAWNQLSGNMHQEGDFWVASWSEFLKFRDGVVKADNLIDYKDTEYLAGLLNSRMAINREWLSLSNFMLHDINHLLPSLLFWQLEMVLDVRARRNKSDRMELLDPHKKYIDRTVERVGELAAVISYPLRFIAGVAKIEQGKELPVSTFKPYELLEMIAYILHGCFMNNDYELLANPRSIPEEIRNRIIVRIPEDLVLTCNKEMLFSILYNLAKNAAKANSRYHAEHDDVSLDNQYFKGGRLKKPCSIYLDTREDDDNIFFLVGDEGNGLSIDNSLQRIHEQLRSMLSKSSVQEVRASEWFWNVCRVLGSEQAEYLIAWPERPMALRGLTVGSLFDLHFLAGFGLEPWGLLGTITSGMGLWGVRYFTERLGGTVMGTNKFEGGALFSLSIPKDQVCYNRENENKIPQSS